MLSIDKKVLNTIGNHQLIADDDHVVAAVSGGPDSVCLLHLLRTLFPRLRIYGAYVNHNLRPDETPVEEKLVEDHCRQLGVDFVSISIDVPAEVFHTGESVEACARRLRYQALENLLSSREADSIAVGHTADDQVEEVLLRLIRGSGLKGLSGMKPHNGSLIRPLLEVGKEEVYAYLGKHELAFCNDSSNESDRFLRNRIRLELLPLLESRFNPSIRKTILKTAEMLRVEEDYLGRETERLYKVLVGTKPQENAEKLGSITVRADRLSAADPALRRRFFEQICWQMGSRPDWTAIMKIDKLLILGSTGSELHLPNRLRVVKQPDSLLFAKLEEHRNPRDQLVDPLGVDLTIPGPGDYPMPVTGTVLSVELVDRRVEPLPDLMVLDPELISFPLRLRAVQPGDRFRPLGGPGTRKVNRFLSDKKIPGRQRHHYPVLVSGKDILCVVGLHLDERYQVTDKTSSALIIRIKEISPAREAYGRRRP